MGDLVDLTENPELAARDLGAALAATTGLVLPAVQKVVQKAVAVAPPVVQAAFVGLTCISVVVYFAYPPHVQTTDAIKQNAYGFCYDNGKSGTQTSFETEFSRNWVNDPLYNNPFRGHQKAYKLFVSINSTTDSSTNTTDLQHPNVLGHDGAYVVSKLSHDVHILFERMSSLANKVVSQENINEVLKVLQSEVHSLKKKTEDCCEHGTPQRDKDQQESKQKSKQNAQAQSSNWLDLPRLLADCGSFLLHLAWMALGLVPQVWAVYRWCTDKLTEQMSKHRGSSGWKSLFGTLILCLGCFGFWMYTLFWWKCESVFTSTMSSAVWCCVKRLCMQSFAGVCSLALLHAHFAVYFWFSKNTPDPAPAAKQEDKPAAPLTVPPLATPEKESDAPLNVGACLRASNLDELQDRIEQRLKNLQKRQNAAAKGANPS